MFDIEYLLGNIWNFISWGQCHTNGFSHISLIIVYISKHDAFFLIHIMLKLFRPISFYCSELCCLEIQEIQLQYQVNQSHFNLWGHVNVISHKLCFQLQACIFSNESEFKRGKYSQFLWLWSSVMFQNIVSHRKMRHQLMIIPLLNQRTRID